MLLKEVHSHVCEVRNEKPSNSGMSSRIVQDQAQERDFSDHGSEAINVVQRWGRVSRHRGAQELVDGVGATELEARGWHALSVRVLNIYRGAALLSTASLAGKGGMIAATATRRRKFSQCAMDLSQISSRDPGMTLVYDFNKAE